MIKIAPSQYALALYESAAIEPTRLKEVVEHFLILLRKRRAVQQLPQIMNALERLGQKKVYVESTLPLSDSQRGAINEKFRGASLEERVDPSLISGIKIRFNDTLIDNTLHSRLINLEKVFSRSN